MMNLFLCCLAAICVAQFTPVTSSTTQTYLVRVETAVTVSGVLATNPSFNPTNQLITVAFVANGAVVTPSFTEAEGGATPVTSGFTFPGGGFVLYSFQSASALSIQLCFNSTALLATAPSCVLLTPIGGEGASLPVTRNNVLLTQGFFPTAGTVCNGNTGSTPATSGSCSITPANQFTATSLSATLTQETFGPFQCDSVELYVRGTQTCPIFLQRSTSNVAENAILATTTFPTLSPTTFSEITVPRDTYAFGTGATAFTVTGTNPLVTNARGADATFSTSGVSFDTFNTFYVAFVNLAHRDTQSVVGTTVVTATASGAAASIVVQDSNSIVLNYIPSLSNAVSNPQFVELYLTPDLAAAGTLTVTFAFNGANAGFGNPAFNGSLAAPGSPQVQQHTLNQDIAAGVQANHYYVFALTTATNTLTSYNAMFFDVTPVDGLPQGTFEQEIINEISGLGAVDLVQINSAVTCGCQDVVSSLVTSSPQIVNGTFSSVGIAASACAGVSSPSPAVLTTTTFSLQNNAGSTACGLDVTILYGREYTVTTEQCTAATLLGGATPTCTSSAFLGTAQTFVGDLNSLPLANTFTSLQSFQMPAPIQLSIPSCSCSAGTSGGSSGCGFTCGESQLLTNLAALSSAVTGSSGSVSGLAGSINTVLTGVNAIKNTVNSVKNLEGNIKQMIKKRC